MINVFTTKSKHKVISFMLIIMICITVIPVVSYADIQPSRDVSDKISITNFEMIDEDGEPVTGDKEYDINSRFKLNITFVLDKNALEEMTFNEGDYFDIIVPEYLSGYGTIGIKNLINQSNNQKMGEYSLIQLDGEDFYRIRVVFENFDQVYTEAYGVLKLEVIAKEVTGGTKKDFEFSDETYSGPIVIDEDYEHVEKYKVQKTGVENKDGTYTWKVGINMDSYTDFLEGVSSDPKEDVVITDELMDGLYYKGDNIKLRIPYYIVNSDGTVTSTEFSNCTVYPNEVKHDGIESWESFQDRVKKANNGDGAYGYYKDADGKMTKLIVALGDIPGTVSDDKSWIDMVTALDGVDNLSAKRKEATLNAYARYYNGDVSNTNTPDNKAKAKLIGFTFSMNTFVESTDDLNVSNSVVFKYALDSSTSTGPSFRYEYDNLDGWIITRSPGEVILKKYDADASNDKNAVTIEGAKFKLLKWNEKSSQFEEFNFGTERQTGTDGSVSFGSIRPGKYKIVETGYAQGYKEDSLKVSQVLFDENGVKVGTEELEFDNSSPPGFIFEVNAKEIDKGVVFEAKNNQEKGDVRIIKKDCANGTGLEGAVFRLWEKFSGKYYETDIYATTNALGIATISGLVWNDYKIEEVGWPDDYMKDHGTIENNGEFTVSAGSVKTITINAENERKPGKVNLTKSDYDTKASMAGISFYLQRLTGENPDVWETVTDSATGNPYKVTTDKNGNASWDNLQWGTYRVSEAAFLPGYEKEIFHEGKYKDNDDYRFEITKGSVTVNFKAENKHERGSIELVKYGISKSEILKGVSFVLQEYKNSTWSTIKGTVKTSDDKGKVKWSGLAWGKYRIVEKESINGYMNSLTLKDKNGNKIANEFDVTGTALKFCVDGYNDRDKGSIALKKYSESDKNVNISGASFQLMKLNGNDWVSEGAVKLSDKNGIVSWDDLKWGTYGIKETGSGFGHTNNLKLLKGYGTEDKVDGIQKLVVTSTALNLKLEGSNPTVPGQVVVEKYAVGDNDKKNPLNGTIFYLKKKNNENNYVTVTAIDGKTITETVTNGQAVFKNLEWGEYQLVEYKAAEGYNKDTFNFPDDGKFTISIDDVTSDGSVALVQLTGTNDTLKGNVTLTKIDEDATAINNKQIEGATFKLWNYDEKSSTWSLVGTEKTGSKGTVKFDGLEWGSYWISESDPAPGYKADSEWSKTPSGSPGNTDQEFRIGEVNSTVVLSVTKKAVNCRLPGELLITKVDEKDHNTKIDGAVFELYRIEGNPNNEVFVASKSSIDGIVTFGGLAWGDYKLYETKSGEDYTTEGVVFLPDDVNTVIADDGSFTLGSNALKMNIKATNSRLLGKVSLEKYDTDQKPLDGAVFKLLDYDGNLISTEVTVSGKAVFENLTWGKYKLVEETAATGYDKEDVVISPVGFKLDNEGYFEVKKGAREFEFTAVNPRLDGSITLTKYDKSQNNIKLKDVEFTLYNSSGQAIKKITDDDGQITFTDLEWGDYKLVETNTKEGYTTNGMIFTGAGISTDGSFTVTADALKFNVEADNPRLPGDVTLTKIDMQTEKVLTGAVFNLLKDGQIIATETAIDGTVKFTNLPWGEYQIVEIEAPESYTTNGMIFSGDGITSTGTFTVGNDSLEFKFYAENPRLKGKVELEKVDKTSKEKLNGVQFTLLDHNGNEVGTQTTQNGKIVFDNLEWGKYKLIETKAKEGYTTSGMIFTGTGISDDGSFTVTKGAISINVLADNPRMDGRVILTKHDKESEKTIDGAVFNLLKDNTVVASETAIDGKVEFKDLEWGSYQLVEAMASPGYDKTDIKFTGSGITDDGKFTITSTALNFIEIEADNGRLPGKLTIEKIDSVNGKKLGDTEFYLQINDGDNWKTITEQDGTTKYGITNDNGKCTFEDLEWGKYRLVEHKAHEGYDKDKVIYSGDSPNDGIFDITSNAIDLSVSAENQRLSGKIKVIKYDSSGTDNVLEGAEFYLRYMSEDSATYTDYTDDNGTTVTAVTNAKGEVVFEDLPWGTYQIAELKAPKGYKNGTLKFVDGTDGTYEITDTVLTVSVQATNDRIPGTLNLEKLDSSDNSKKLRGGEFTLEYYDQKAEGWLPYTDESGQNVIEITNSDGKLKFSDLPWGKYKVIELVAPEGYDDNSLEFANGTEEITVNEEQQTSYLTAYNTTVLGEEDPPNDTVNKDGSVLGKTGDWINLMPLFIMILIISLIFLAITLHKDRRMIEEEGHRIQ